MLTLFQCPYCNYTFYLTKDFTKLRECTKCGRGFRPSHKLPEGAELRYMGGQYNITSRTGYKKKKDDLPYPLHGG